MSDRPILFSGPMVRALNGRKTQTRRIIKPQPHIQPAVNDEPAHEPFWCVWKGDEVGYRVPVRFQKGDRLWVRETWRTRAAYDGLTPKQITDEALFNRVPVSYEADSEPSCDGKKRVAIHLPRKFSRITLAVTDVRVERLQAISEIDAMAEGVPRDTEPCDHHRQSCKDIGCLGPTYKAAFCALWCQINGNDAWAANPWVVAVSFSMRNGNIDEIEEQGFVGHPTKEQ